MSRPWTEEELAEVIRLAGVPDGAPERALLVELWGHRESDAPPAQLELPAADALGGAADAAGDSEADLSRRVLRLGRALVDGAIARGDLPGGESDRARLHSVVDEASARALDAFARARLDRREAWLSFLNHELKNPLNTVLNALWLLREHRDAPNAERFLELAERAVRKMEAILKDLRDLHRKSSSSPPTREDRPR